MKIYNTIGSKERLFEMMNNVNKITLNENYENNPLLVNSLEGLINGTIKIDNTKTNLDDDVTYITINATDESGSNMVLIFKISSKETEMDSVYGVDNVVLKSFEYVNSLGEKTEFNEDDLSEFNEKYSSGLYNIIDKYVDIEVDTTDEDDMESDDELYEESIKKIDGISHKDFAKTELSRTYDNLNSDTKSKLIKASMLFIIDKFKIRPGDMDRSLYDELVKFTAIELYNSSLKKLNETDVYPDKIGKEFKTKSDYPKQKKDRVKKVKLSEIDDEVSPEITNIDGNGESSSKFDRDQIRIGMKAEMEHTDDPIIALEMVLVHLTEDPNFYMNENTDDVPHASGAYIEDGIPGELDRNGHPIPTIDPNFSKMQGDFGVEDNTEDILLGYKPKNVGYNINEEGYEGKVGGQG